MFFTPRLNHERIGGEIYFSPETKINIGESSVSEYIADTVTKKLFVTSRRNIVYQRAIRYRRQPDFEQQRRCNV